VVYVFRKSRIYNGIIKIDDIDADNILDEHDLNIPLHYLFDFAKAFCIGANVPMIPID